MNDSGIMRAGESPPSGANSGIFLPLDDQGGIELNSLKPGTILEVETKNHTYTVIPQEQGGTLIWGHPEYCPEPVVLEGVGSSYVTGVFREGYLGSGMRLNFPRSGKRVSTSRIVAIKAKRHN